MNVECNYVNIYIVVIFFFLGKLDIFRDVIFICEVIGVSVYWVFFFNGGDI